MVQFLLVAWLQGLLGFLEMMLPPVAREELTVRVVGIRPGHGKVLVAVLTKGEYPSAGNLIPRYYQLLDGSMPEQTASFDKIPFGEYAIGCYQDENANLLLDKNPMGIPVEAFAFSNNPSAKWKKPSYKQALVSYGEAHHHYQVAIKTWGQYWRE